MSGRQNGGFHVDCSEAVGDSLRRLREQADRRGQGHAFVAVFHKILQNLRLRPRAAGEPLYRLPSLRLQVRAIAVMPLAIEFAVSETMPIVYIKSGKLLAPPGYF